MGSAVSATTAGKDDAAAAGIGDAVVREKTGRTWGRWVRMLDQLGARWLSHREIVGAVRDEFKTGSWWTPMVTVGYERIAGLRATGQKRGGSYEISKSKTFNVPMAARFAAWNDARLRRRWLTGATVSVRTATPAKSIRLDWSDGAGSDAIIAVGFTRKGASKSTIALAHAKTPDRESAERIKTYWSERLRVLGEMLDERAAS
jgi:hypothetical protein